MNSRHLKNNQLYPTDLDKKFSQLSVTSSNKSIKHEKTETKLKAKVYTEASSRHRSRKLSASRNNSVKKNKMYLKKHSSEINQKDKTSRKDMCKLKKD